MKKLIKDLLLPIFFFCLVFPGMSEFAFAKEDLKIKIPYIKETKHVLRIAHGGIANMEIPVHRASVLFAELVDTYTRGEVNINIYPNSQLGSEEVTAKMVNLGTLDMTLLSINNATQWYPPMNVYMMPFIFRDRDHVNKVIYGPVGRELEENYLKASKMRIIDWLEWGDRCPLTRSRAINTPADMKGLKMRTPKNPVMIDTYNALGAISTAINWGSSIALFRKDYAMALKDRLWDYI